MRHLKKFNEMVTDIESDLPKDSVYSHENIDKHKIDNDKIIYNPEWEKALPNEISINYHDKIYKFRKGNVMLVGDLVEITYESYPSIWGSPDTLEFDIYFAKNNESGNLRLNVDITYGDLVACEFSLEEPNKIKVIQYTSYHSKFDPSNTVFSLSDESLDKFIEFLNKFPGIKISREEMKFLDQYDNWKPV